MAIAIVAAPIALEGGATILAQQSISLSLAKTGISASAQYLANSDGNVNVLGAVADGFLTTGASAYLGAAFEVNFKSGDLSFRTAFSDKKSFSDFTIEGASSFAFGKKSGYFSKLLDDANLPSNALKGSTNLLYETISQATNYNVQNTIKEKVNE